MTLLGRDGHFLGCQTQIQHNSSPCSHTSRFANSLAQADGASGLPQHLRGPEAARPAPRWSFPATTPASHLWAPTPQETRDRGAVPGPGLLDLTSHGEIDSGGSCDSPSPSARRSNKFRMKMGPTDRNLALSFSRRDERLRNREAPSGGGCPAACSLGWAAARHQHTSLRTEVREQAAWGSPAHLLLAGSP